MLHLTAIMNNQLMMLNRYKGVSNSIFQKLRSLDNCFNRKFTSNVLKNCNFQTNAKLFRTWETTIYSSCIHYGQTRTLTSFSGTGLCGLNISKVSHRNTSLQKSSPYVVPLRHKSGARKRSKLSKSEDSDSDVEDNTDDDDGDESDVDDDVPKGYRDITAHVKSLRIDSVLAAGLNISKSKIDDFFLQSKLRLNNEKVLKKARKVSEGDELDLIHEYKDDVMKVKRVYIKKILPEKTGGDRFVVKLRTWRTPIETENID
ncbi:unnamed protein product [Owenia fusiformis]|uniref:Uncharacterized protein n=1 Tax=Owenia fusiformis TaxID=6347 RepID=A0A8J1TCD1_OWEFU|nr:unnamed protein product [Owenia fusiformis]